MVARSGAGRHSLQRFEQLVEQPRLRAVMPRHVQIREVDQKGHPLALISQSTSIRKLPCGARRDAEGWGGLCALGDHQ